MSWSYAFPPIFSLIFFIFLFFSRPFYLSLTSRLLTVAQTLPQFLLPLLSFPSTTFHSVPFLSVPFPHDSWLTLHVTQLSRRGLVPKDEVRLSVSELSEISDGCKYAPSSQRRRGQDGELGDSGYLYILLSHVQSQPWVMREEYGKIRNIVERRRKKRTKEVKETKKVSVKL